MCRQREQHPCRFLLPLVLAVLATGLVSACGVRGTPGTPEPSQPAAGRPVELAVRDGLLVDSQGHPLYVNDQEMGGGIRCTTPCVDTWQPVIAPRTGAPSQPVPGLGVLRRSDTGLDQLTYLRQPLYLYRMDGAPGQARGDGVRDTYRGLDFTWRAVRVTGPARTTGGAPDGSGY